MADPRPRSTERIQHALEALIRYGAGRRRHLGRAAAAGVPLKESGYVVLRFLGEHGPSAARTVADGTGTQLATTYRAIDGLLADGRVARVAVRSDGRSRRMLALTASGEDAYRRLSGVAADRLRAALADWSAADRERFTRLFTAFVADAAGVAEEPGRAAEAGEERLAG